MSIPGLGQIPTKPAASAVRTYTLQPLWEYRFEVAHGSTATVTLVSGTAERDGTELAAGVPYRLSGAKSKLLSWRGATLTVEGPADDYVAETATPNPATGAAADDPVPCLAHLNLHALLQRQRDAVASSSAGTSSGQKQQQQQQQQQHGPRVLVAGSASSGRTSLVRTLAAWAARAGSQPTVANADPREGVLTLPGTLSAAVFATPMDPASGEGWGSAPSSGPGAVPVKLPLVYHYGRQRAEEDPPLYRALASSLASAVAARAVTDPDVRAAGLLVDSPPWVGGAGVETLAHLVEEFSVNIVVVLGSARLTQELTRRFATEKTSLGEPISVVSLDKSDGVVERDEGFLQQCHEAAIKEYFFGDAGLTLSPSTQQVSFDDVHIYMPVNDGPAGPPVKSAEDGDYKTAATGTLEKLTQPLPELAHWTLAMMNASPGDPPDRIRSATVAGFVYVAAVDKERRRMKILAPVSGRLGDRPLVWGRWPEPHINLLG
ncbi:Clp1 [Gaeumannomyces tritici R3-111a-1]|uniref:Polynucleotide 5'-hydroxyl-kinase GRC3 n=1 Tax=Gaeumannomyces tritici (strain R3-111a-1) TaxID=644352 RepID=J3P6E3_GAET3|nr:Clp1 [Gaeumannomyces tritici R3-111a-1]EJT72217.1 Clp1 [Gaeumannomyces tritici R3-111a-1]